MMSQKLFDKQSMAAYHNIEINFGIYQSQAYSDLKTKWKRIIILYLGCK